jgi:endoglucanase
LAGKGDRDRPQDVKDMLVDVGASSRAEAEALGIRPGSPIVPATKLFRLHGDRVCGKAFDDRLGCAVCIETVACAEKLPCALVGVGSVQEEVGLRGVRTAIRVAAPDVAIVLEGSPADDVGGGPGDEAQGRLGGGVQIRAFDPTMIAPRGFVELAIETARSQEIPHQLAVRPTGGTDAGRLHLESVGIPTLVLAAPVRYAHSHTSVLALSDLDALGRLTRALLARLDAATVETAILGSPA